MSIKMPKLNVCPLCGGKARFVKARVYNSDAYRVECECCHLSTIHTFVGISGLPGSVVPLSYNTPSIAKYNAGIMWNKLPINKVSCLSTADRIFQIAKMRSETKQALETERGAAV